MIGSARWASAIADATVGFRGCLQAVGEVNTMGCLPSDSSLLITAREREKQSERRDILLCCCLILVGIAIGGATMLAKAVDVLNDDFVRSLWPGK